MKDAALNALYRQLYSTPHRQYALTVPFMELLFRLARPADRDRPAGWVGQLTSNSFMKREFGSKLIEQFLPNVDLRAVIDTSGAYIPGHGTPTVIVVGRNQRPTTDTVRAVLGIRGEPGRPEVPSKGFVWSSISFHVDEPGYEDQHISVVDLARDMFYTHPWSLSGGGAVETTIRIEKATTRLNEVVQRIGFQAMSHADEEFTRPLSWRVRNHCAPGMWPMLGEGTDVRDYRVRISDTTWFPYVDGEVCETPETRNEALKLWAYRATLEARATFAGETYRSAGRHWYEWHQVPADECAAPFAIAFAFVSTHNHFVLNRGARVFKQTAPVIKLAEGARIEDHLRLLGVLNSSVACFWLKQSCFNKGSRVDQSGARTTLDTWENFYEFTGTTLKEFPLPANTPVERAKILDNLAADLQKQTPREVASTATPSAHALTDANAEYERLRRLMIAQQEELDWDYYRIYGLIEDDLTYKDEVPEIVLGQRAFEIALARRMNDGEETAWFERHSSTPITEIPDRLPADYRAMLQRRLDAIESNPHIRLLERPEYKRRWAVEPWERQVQTALRDWLLDRVEDKSLWFDRDSRPTPMSLAQLADALDRNDDFRSVLRLWACDDNVATGTALAKLLADESVPYLSAYRYKPAGLEKRAVWEQTWELQRREDRSEKLDAPIPVPPKYKPADFAKTSYWSHRGKLDVPKERFISYPGAGRDSDTTELLGWAGWDHADQALALAGLVSQRIEDGWDTPKLVPMLAGLNELLPWVRQWHNQIDPEYGESVADTIGDELTTRLNEHHLTVTELSAWRPVPIRTPRTRKTS